MILILYVKLIKICCKGVTVLNDQKLNKFYFTTMCHVILIVKHIKFSIFIHLSHIN